MGARTDRESLVLRAQEGDRSAFEALLEGCRDKLENFVGTRIGDHLRQEVDVEDVLQETYARALKSISEFRWRGRGSFSRWLNAIAEHVIVSLARRKKTRDSRTLFLEQELVREDPAPSKALRRKERLDRLQQAGSLPLDEECIAAFRMHARPESGVAIIERVRGASVGAALAFPGSSD